jgi:hypothetical protein
LRKPFKFGFPSRREQFTVARKSRDRVRFALAIFVRLEEPS